MRLQRLDLIRYGKFTDRSITFTAGSEYDFHLVLGPNEAGKSTLRQAILDLLFGFPVRTPLDFIHAKSELRLGALLQQGSNTLDFLRLKANKNSLRATDEVVLPDTALDPYLQGVSKAFFDKMFGLDHLRLTQGGNSILSAQDDVGQILFQSAAGLVSLGKVRDALEAEADSLWAPTRSMKRAYHAAKADLDEADLALKQATVHPRKWTEAHERVQELEAQWQEQRRVLAGLQAQRDRLERIRRVSPLMQDLNESLRQQAALGEVVVLAPDAAQILEQAQRNQIIAQHGLQARHAELQRLQAALEKIDIDENLLGLSNEIHALDALRHQLANHPSAIERYEGQLQQLLQQALQQFDELGLQAVQVHMPAHDSLGAEQALRNRLPALPLRKHTEQLLREHGAMDQALRLAQTALRERQAEAASIEARLQDQPLLDVSNELREALSQVQSLGDITASEQTLQHSAQQAREVLAQAQAGLGAWRHLAAQLSRTAWPSAQSVATRLAERRELLAAVRLSAQRCDELSAAAEKAALHLRQYREQHHPVMLEDLMQARQQRDEIWHAIRQGTNTLSEAAEPFEASLLDADALADRRHDKAQEAAHMQGLQHQWELAQQAFQQAQNRHNDAQQVLSTFDEQWQHTCSELGLAGLDLEQMPDWLLQKDRVLQAEQVLLHAEQEHLRLQEVRQTARNRLTKALINHQVMTAEAAQTMTLESLRVQAEAYLGQADAVAARHEAWQTQAAQARVASELAQQALTDALARQSQWQQAWSGVMAQIGLEPNTSPGLAEGALALYASITDKLEQIRRLRTERLDPMQAELLGFIEQTVRVAHAAGENAASAEKLSCAEAFDICQVLAQRLHQVVRAQEEAVKLGQALEQEQADIRAAEQTEQLSRASLQPLFTKAGVDTLDALEQAIRRSDQYRLLSQRIQQIHDRLAQESDGLTQTQVQEELGSIDVATLPELRSSIQVELEESTHIQNELAVQLADARRELQAIAGVDDAAQAEARRQDALARMGDAAERYIKVFTATRLLRWSIERYREEKQGPMLARASAIFSQLTQGSFEKLRVDFDRQPMALEGQRADGRLVGIDGLSEGTRDQLYLALRLAALELHLQQSPALPFVADDLFINYDDARSEAGLRALAELSRQTQVIFLSHHDALLEPAQRVFGKALNVVRL